MYLAVEPEPSCAHGWVSASRHVIENGDEAYNVIIEIADPINHSESDHEVISRVDQFLRDHDKYPIISVANTIFPQALYESVGVPEIYDAYLELFGVLTRMRGWGRYFERMITHEKVDGQRYNPLHQLIEKLRQGEERGQRYKAAYELAVYDPLRDGRALWGNLPCLSFISLKRHPDMGLLMTAVYRNHHYITRCLGNLIGLGRLQAFVAEQAGIDVGSLTVISTHAEIDRGNGWGITEARSLVNSAAAVLH